MPSVNLDALIRRADLYENPTQAISSSRKTTLSIRDLERGEFFYESLRKPDFQRETSDWDTKKICDLIRSFIDGDLIPAVIFWRHGDLNFVVDGAHRLGALIAWLQDDYGDGATSRAFFGESISDEQKRISERTRKEVQRLIGAYREIKYASANPEAASADYIRVARNLSAQALTIQWVDGDAGKVEASFKKINQKAAPIDQTELTLIENRRKPNAIAARAIHHRGAGNEYWKHFPSDTRKEIESIAKDIFDVLFNPDSRDYIKSFNAPIGGLANTAQTLPMIFHFVNFANGVKDLSLVQDDLNGSKTVDYLKNVRKISRRLGGPHMSSLGLHPFVYFYSPTGKHQPILFHAIVSFVADMDTNSLVRFTSVRRAFENFVVRNRTLMSQIIRKFGSKDSGRENLVRFYSVLTEVISDRNEADIVPGILKRDSSFSFLQPAESAEGVVHSKEFSSDTKAAVLIREHFKSGLRCSICGGFMPVSSITFDHITHKRSGGLGSSDNAQLVHPFCNSTAKDQLS